MKIRKLNICIGLLFLGSVFESCASKDEFPDRKWFKTVGGSAAEYLESCIGVKDGSVVSVGYTNSSDLGVPSNGGSDALIIKHDIDGNVVWINSFGGSNNERFNSVIETSKGDLIAIGNSASTNIDGLNISSSNYYDAIIVKYNSSGKQIWAKSFGSSTMSDTFMSVTEVNGGYVAVGDSKNIMATSTDTPTTCNGLMVKFNENGDDIWDDYLIGSGLDYLNSVVSFEDDSFIAVGNSNSSNLGFSLKGGSDGIIVKYDAYGNQKWVKNFGGSRNDFGESIIKTKDNSIAVAGYTLSTDIGEKNNGNFDGLIAKFDTDGNQTWIKLYGGTSTDYFNEVTEDEDGNLFIVGRCSPSALAVDYVNNGDYDALIVKYDGSGNYVWAEAFGGSGRDYFMSVTTTFDNDIVAVGYSGSKDDSIENKGSFDCIVVKYAYFKALEEEAVKKAQRKPSLENISDARTLVNAMSESLEKDRLQSILNGISPDLELEKISVTSNVDVYIVSQNILSLSLNTNSITFEGFSGIEELEMQDAVKLTVNSSLPYELKSYLENNIANADNTNVLEPSTLNVKINNDVDYKTFTNIKNGIVLIDNGVSGNNNIHSLDIKLSSRKSFTPDVYKAVVKLEVAQK